MPRFKKENIKNLKDFLYNSNFHDAELKNIEYECREDCIKIELVNPIFDVRINFKFLNIGGVFAHRGKMCGSRETIISLTAEEDFSYLQNYIPSYNEGIADSLYLLFQMFSGDELHIIAEEVIVELTKK